MEVGVEKCDVEVTGLSEAKNEAVIEGQEKETELRTSGQLEEEGEVTEEERDPVLSDKKLEVERMEENQPDRRRGRMRVACTKSMWRRLA
jgi:vacuolar-type H+-ATPase subunit H